MFRLGSLRARLLALVLGLVLAVWAVAAAATWRDVRHELDELLDSHLAQAAALLVVQQGQGREFEDEGEHEVDAPLLHPYAPRSAFQVFHDGRLVLRSATAPLLPMIGPAGHRPAAVTGFRSVRIDGVDWRVFAATGAERDVQVFVGEQIDARGAILWAVLRNMLWPIAVALPLLALAAAWAVHRGLWPLRRLGQTLADRRPQALQPVALDDAPTEMRPVLAALNGLFGRIEALMQAERRFTADAAHELRTPIAAVRAQAQVAMAEPDVDRRHAALQATLDGCDRATRLVEQLLTLARLEAGAAPEFAPVALDALARQEAATLGLAAVRRQQTLAVDADLAGVAPVRGNAPLLSALLRNLLDNAIRYSPPQATIAVRVAAVPATAGQAGGIGLRIDDSGPGLDDAQRARLGERFFRVGDSGMPGSGLGWSIVQRIAAAHGARWQVGRSATLGGLAVELVFPADR